MLCLSRRLGEKIYIGTPPNVIVVTVVDISRDGKIRLGVEAGKDVPIQRLENLPPDHPARTP